MHLHCCYGTCKSDSRRPEAGVTFMPFPKPFPKSKAFPKAQSLKIAKRWVYLCANQLTIKSINRFTYICSKHFPVGSVLNIKTNPSLEPFNARKNMKEVAKVQESARVQRVWQRTHKARDNCQKAEDSKADEGPVADQVQVADLVENEPVSLEIPSEQSVIDMEVEEESMIDMEADTVVPSVCIPSPSSIKSYSKSKYEDSAKSDTDSASESESAFWQDDEGVHYNIDIEPVPSQSTIIFPISPEQKTGLKSNQRSQGVQVDVLLKDELAALRAQVRALKLENKRLKDTISQGMTVNSESHPKKLTAKERAEKTYDWIKESPKKFKFFTGR